MLETLRSYWSIISTIITVVAVPAVGYLYKKYKQADARQKAVELGVQALLRDRIVQSYYHYEERGWIRPLLRPPAAGRHPRPARMKSPLLGLLWAPW